MRPRADSAARWVEELADALEGALDGPRDGAIDEGQVMATLRECQRGLDELRQELGPEAWQAFCGSFAATRLHPLLQQDPYTQRAYSKPRGIAGDAVMLDFCYGHPAAAELVSAATALGRAILAGTAGEAEPAQAVRRRRKLAARFAEECGERGARGERTGTAAATVYALAAGHLREYESVEREARERLQVYAWDGDPANREQVVRDYPQVQAAPLDLRQWLRQAPTAVCDGIYALGLFDYLHDGVAANLLQAMWGALRPGGQLLVGNFVPDAPGLGYMEAAMAWRLRYRTAAELGALSAGIGEAADRTTWVDEVGCLAYLQMRKA